MDDGGSAFPKQPIFHFPDGTSVVSEQGGMSMRDWFAGQAMPLLVDMGTKGHLSGEDVAKWCYGFADAMLQERDKRNG